MKFIEFNSKEEMIAYETDRENYYMQFLNAKNTFEFYKLWFKELFVKEYRELKKKYDGYCGGWYRDKDGIIHTENISCVDSDKVKNGDICIEECLDKDYVFHNNTWIRVL